MPATVSVDGLHTAWTAEVCTGEHARAVTVVRFDHDTLADAIDTLHTFYADQLPGSGLPQLDLYGDVLVTTWFTGTPHAQSQVTLRRRARPVHPRSAPVAVDRHQPASRDDDAQRRRPDPGMGVCAHRPLPSSPLGGMTPPH
ncbi:hypothetical protein ACN27G_29640 [Plantactinospora sp. WMMB334]|uniref:hypothetical protein n=1 Tax=Plantactinospora sp. WMMB334 TaxID=3404119 RepID=UPI003B953785